MRPYYIKDITIHNDRKLTIGLYEDLQYADGKGNHVNLVGKTPKSIFDKHPPLSDTLNFKVDSLIHIDAARIRENPTNSWFSSDVVSKVG